MPNPTITEILRGTSRTDIQILDAFKGIVHPNVTILSLFTHLNVVLNLYDFSFHGKQKMDSKHKYNESIMNFYFRVARTHFFLLCST